MRNWIIGEHFLKGRVVIEIDEDDNIENIKRHILPKMEIIDVVSSNKKLKKEIMG